VARLRSILGLSAGRVFDGKTDAAVRTFQKERGLSVDGAAGPKTLGAMGIGPIYGIDVSRVGQDKDGDLDVEVDWAKVRGDGVRFAIVKSSQGVWTGGTYDKATQTWFRNAVKGAKAAGLATGAYHYANVRDVKNKLIDPTAEAAGFAKAIGKQGPGDLPAFLDLESMRVDGMKPDDLDAWAFDFLSFLIGKGYRVGFYSGAWYMAKINGGRRVRDLGVPMWFARYNGSKDPGQVGAFPSWDLWQFTGDGSVAGVPGRCDVNLCVGGESAFRRLQGAK
jgi:GH25 family lysozyme M1 (1,4-beta-N-acetylmuramidase)